jgi:hypothetical protein
VDAVRPIVTLEPHGRTRTRVVNEFPFADLMPRRLATQLSEGRRRALDQIDDLLTDRM